MIQNDGDVQKCQRANTFDRHPFLEWTLPRPLNSGEFPPLGCSGLWPLCRVSLHLRWISLLQSSFSKAFFKWKHEGV